MTVVVAYEQDGCFRMASDRLVTYESGDRGTSDKIYQVGDWLVGESGDGEPVGLARRALRRAVLQGSPVDSVDDLCEIVWAAIKDVNRKTLGVTLLCHHPVHGLYRIEEDVDPAHPAMLPVAAIGSGTDFVLGYLRGWLATLDMSEGCVPSRLISDHLIEAAIRACASAVPSVGGYCLKVRT